MSISTFNESTRLFVLFARILFVISYLIDLHFGQIDMKLEFQTTVFALALTECQDQGEMIPTIHSTSFDFKV